MNWFRKAGIGVLALIPITALLLMFEVITLPNAHRGVGYFVAGYLVLVLVLLGRNIVLDLVRSRPTRR